MTIKTIHRLTACALMAASFSASAATVTLEGTSVIFSYDDTMPGMPAFGTLSVVGDSIFAIPQDFTASASNGAFDEFSASGTITITAKSGYSFSSLQFAQQGTYSLIGESSVTASGTLGITDAAMTVSESATLNTSYNSNTTWLSTAGFDLSTTTWNNITEIELSLDSLLTANTAGLGDFAEITSSNVGTGLLTIETVVPVPAAVWLFASGLLGLVGFSRHNRKRSAL